MNDAPHAESPNPDFRKHDGLPLISPDREEVEHADEIDNAIPSRGYSTLRVVALGGSAGSIPAMREFFENTPASSSDDLDIQKAHQLGAREYIVKPHTLKELVKIVSSLQSRWLSGASITQPESSPPK